MSPAAVGADAGPAAAARLMPRVLPAVSAPVSASAPDAAFEELWLAFQINNQGVSDTVLVLRNAGRLMVRGEDLQRWRLRLPEGAALSRNGEAWFPLDKLGGATFVLDEARQELALGVPAALFDSTALGGLAEDYLVPTQSPPGGFFNYDVTAGSSSGETYGSGLFELGGFKGATSGVSTFLLRDSGQDRGLVRLDTTWTHDRPATRTSLRLGDTITGTSSWGRSVRIGGIQWATNFATQPSLVTYPRPGMAGEAVLPSTVDLYVNDALRMRRDVPAGPFSIQDLPIVTGQGEARLVVRDALGRERVITAPYYATPSLLRAGLQDYSYELGFVRTNYGLASMDYGRFAAVGSHRIGLTDAITGETHAELLRDQQTLGFGSALLWPAAGVFSASVAASRSDGGAGAMMGMGFQRQSNTFSIGGNVQLASDNFRQLGAGVVNTEQGFEAVQEAPRMTGVLFASLATRGYGSFGVSHVQRRYRDTDEVKLFNASYSIGLGKLGSLSVAALRSLGADAQTSIRVLFTRALGNQTTASAGLQRQGNDLQQTVQVQRNLPQGSGYGYRLLAAAGEPQRREASLVVQNSVGTYTLDAAQYQGGTGVRAGASGGVAVLGGGAFLSRRIDGSFAVVNVSEYPDVRVYADNQVVAQTNADGNALLPRLRPYQKNSIRIEQADLPMDAQITTEQLTAVPYVRSGVLIQFPVRRSSGAVLTIRLDDGQFLPAGARVGIEGGQEDFPVGLRGEVFLMGLSATNRLVASWRGQSCTFGASFPATSEPQPDLGTFTCTGVNP